MKKSRRRSVKGTMVVEAAILFPLFLMLALGAIEYGWLLFNLQRITTAAREGARIAILPYSDAEEHAVDVVNAWLIRANLAQYGPTVEVDSPGPIDPSDPNSPTAERVRVEMPTDDLLIVNCSLFPTPDKLRATVIMAREGGT
jgi:hypothetical protein